MNPAVQHRDPACRAFATVRHGQAPLRDALAEELVRALLERGHYAAAAGEVPGFVVQLTSATSPVGYRRRDASLAVVSLVEAHGPVDGWKDRAYTTLIRTLSNALLWIWPPDAGPGEQDRKPTVGIVTPEAGFTCMPFEAQRVACALEPIVRSQFALGNDLTYDLEEHVGRSSPVVAELCRRGSQLASWGVLPTPFPLADVLPPADLRQLRRLFGLSGLSYGNLSAREDAPSVPEGAFWMTGRGVDKARLAGAGRDLMLVTGLAPGPPPRMQVRVPAGTDPEARVSVDAIEHLKVYRRFPEVRAIVHVHAWLPGVASTRQVHPCGTVELADEVAERLAEAPDPAAAVVGLRNHGLTATGRSLADVFDRLAGRLVTVVPMEA